MTSVENTIRQLAADCRLSATFDFDGFRVSIVTNDQKLKAELEQYYAVFRTEETKGARVVAAWAGDLPPLAVADWQVNHPEPGKHRIKEHFARLNGGTLIRKVQTGVHLAWLDGLLVAFGPLNDNPNQVVNFVNNIYLDHLLAKDGQLFHAAGVCNSLGRGIGLAGRSGMGKSTLALRLLEAGLDFVSNDRLVVQHPDGGLTMQGVPKYPRINPGTIVNQDALLPLASEVDLARYRQLSVDELWDLEEKYDAFVDEYFDGCQFRLGAKMNAFVLIDWDRKLDAPPILTQKRASEVPELIPDAMKLPGIMLPGASARIPALEVEPYQALLDQTRLYVLTGGVDFDEAARLLRSTLA